jgi:hypothetical protein
MHLPIPPPLTAALALLGFLSDNHLKHAQSNTVFPTQEEMDRVGFEPTTSAFAFFRGSSISYSREQLWEKELIAQILLAQLFFFLHGL